MRVERWKWWGIVLTVAGVLVGGVGSEAFAAKKRLSARINGHGVKIPGKFAAGSTNGFGAIVIAGAKPARPGKLIRTLTLGCLVPDLSTATFPLTVNCGGGYIEARASVNPMTRAWATEEGIQLIITSYKGIRLTGTFSGMFERPGDTNPTDPPARVENGKVSVDLFGG